MFKKRVSKDACPFNVLYLDFLARNEDKLKDNNRLAMPYRTWNKMAPDVQNELRASAKAFLERL